MWKVKVVVAPLGAEVERLMIRYAVVDGVIQQRLAVYPAPALQVEPSLRNDGSRSEVVEAATV